MKDTFAVRAKIWIYPGDAAWHFVTIPDKISQTIKENFGKHARGWRSLPVEVTLGKTKWKTSIFPDKRNYLLPLKLAVRRAEGVAAEDIIRFSLRIRQGHP